jgi:tetratricopeptide (TPR) repeat protein
MTGILTKNNVTRNRHLRENLGFYRGYENGSHDITYYTNKTRPLSNIMNGQDLYNYTHNERTDYSKMIGHVYFKHRPDFQPYINIDPSNPQNFWGGEYHDYYDYVNAVYSQITPPIQFIEGLLSTQFLDEAIRVTSPAIVHNPEPTLSIGGAVKTNVNNFSGTDTRTGLLGNQMYAHTLYHGANFNTMRKGTTIFINNHITPSAYIRFGNSNYTINSLSSIVSPLRADGKIIEDYNSGIKIIDDVKDIIEIEDALKTLQDKEYVYQQEKDAYKKAKEQYKKDLKEYKKNGKQGTKPKKPEKPIHDTSIQYTDINPTNLFKTLALNKYFDINTKNFIKYTGENTNVKTEEEINGEKIEVEKELSFNFSEPARTSGGSVIHGVYDIIDIDEDKDDGGDIYKEICGINLNEKSLLKKTHDLFQRVRDGEENIYTNLGFEKFYDSKYDLTKTTFFDTSTTEVGRSRGRNLLKKEVNQTDNEGKTTLKENPFCRTWTYRHQYDKLNKLIRPFSDENGNTMKIRDVQELNKRYRSKHITTIKNEDGSTSSTITFNESGGEYLANNTVLNDNGFVQITPHRNGNADIKKYMFSIENLAWKDVLDKDVYLSKEQRGPNGGRIMWFPPYDLSFQENTNVNWEQNTFIGRGEKIYTYSNTDRTGSLSFTLLIDHPSTIHNIYNEDGQILNNPIDGKQFTDEDILRFFAGCSPIEQPTIIEKKTKTEKEPKIAVLPKVETKTIFVYFPNNYTGHYTSKVTEKSKNTTTPPDDDFLEYMVFGTNAAYFKNVHESIQNGYEMSEKGLNYEVEGLDWIYERTTIPVCEKYELYKECTKTYDELKYFYRVDNDLRQHLNIPKNYKDTESHQLNSKEGEGNYQFIELAYLLAKDDLKERIAEKFPEVTGTTLTKIFSNENIDRIINISFKGSASEQDSKNSPVLAARRASTLRSLIIEKYPTLSRWCLLGKNSIGKVNEKDEYDINSKSVKQTRFVRIEITYMLDETEEFVTGYTTKNIEYEEDVTEAKLTKTYNEDGKTIDYRRYETEAEYFSNLQSTDALTFRRLTDKFKYFTPAFHSVSPEGFNARLTFLQQCTRQGHTIEPIIKQGTRQAIAGNLAFGRMPVCVLRIGDFIYTKILINSISINYENNGMQWDLNPEGIGVQPMSAKVNLSITILGGQSLEGPISRLQNAVSFNYYANAGVYDDRADRARPSKTGEGQWSTDYYYAWTPESQNKTETSKK